MAYEIGPGYNPGTIAMQVLKHETWNEIVRYKKGWLAQTLRTWKILDRWAVQQEDELKLLEAGKLIQTRLENDPKLRELSVDFRDTMLLTRLEKQTQLEEEALNNSRSIDLMRTGVTEYEILRAWGIDPDL